ncbi:MAG: sortase [Frankiales bacterium]|jgi:sortase A|nr:sortase [Frankiales bacterium]
MMTTITRRTGWLLITPGILTLLYVGYELWGTGLSARAAQHSLGRELQQEWSTPSVAEAATAQASPVDGQPIAILTVARLGAGYQEIVIEGTSTADLRKAPGHYPGTALPGQLGNFAVAGHRTTYGAPFGDLNLLRAGDIIAIRVATTSYEYRVTGHEIVSPSENAVVAPTPDQPGTRPVRRMLTLTTCHPKYSANKRLVVHALLVAVRHAAVTVAPAVSG